MQLVILMVGKTRAAFIQEGMDFYRKRLALLSPVISADGAGRKTP